MKKAENEYSRKSAHNDSNEFDNHYAHYAAHSPNICHLFDSYNTFKCAPNPTYGTQNSNTQP